MLILFMRFISVITSYSIHYTKLYDAESVDDSMRTANDLLSKYKDLKGLMSFGSQGPIGAGRAIAKRQKNDDICLFGTFTPGQGIKLLEKGAIDGGYISNPKVAGQVFV